MTVSARTLPNQSVQTHLEHAQVDEAPVTCALHFAQRIARARHPRLVHRRLAFHKREQRDRPCRGLLAFVRDVSISDVVEYHAGVVGIVEGGRGRSTARWRLEDTTNVSVREGVHRDYRRRSRSLAFTLSSCRTRRSLQRKKKKLQSAVERISKDSLLLPAAVCGPAHARAGLAQTRLPVALPTSLLGAVADALRPSSGQHPFLMVGAGLLQGRQEVASVGSAGCPP
jgi:hypothetical protein